MRKKKVNVSEKVTKHYQLAESFFRLHESFPNFVFHYRFKCFAVVEYDFLFDEELIREFKKFLEHIGCTSYIAGLLRPDYQVHENCRTWWKKINVPDLPFFAKEIKPGTNTIWYDVLNDAIADLHPCYKGVNAYYSGATLLYSDCKDWAIYGNYSWEIAVAAFTNKRLKQIFELYLGNWFGPIEELLDWFVKDLKIMKEKDAMKLIKNYGNDYCV